MKLFCYDHCPYCTRVRLYVGIQELKVEEVTLLNDDHETPEGLIGKKMVPILIKEDGEAMGESLDIVEYLDKNYDGAAQWNLTPDDDVARWVANNHKLINYLFMPRCVKVGLEEFKTKEAIAYFVKKKEDYIGSFEEHLKETPKYIAEMQTALQELLPLVKKLSENKDSYQLADVILFPVLRNLTMVKDLEFEPQIHAYLSRLSQASGVNLFTDHAI